MNHPTPLPESPDALPPVTPEQAREHREVLDAEVAQYELDHPTGRDSGWRKTGPMTASVKDELARKRRERGAA